MSPSDWNSRLSSTQTNALHPGMEAVDAISLGNIQDHVGYHVRRLQVWIFRDFINTLSPLNIKPVQFSVLTVIAENPGLSQADLSATLGIESSRLVRILDGLEDRELLNRERSPTDRRSHALTLGKKGLELLVQANRLADEHEARLAECIGEDYDKLLTILKESCAFTKSP
jgi:DNA-binding MarR family transcriptional regulator